MPENSLYVEGSIITKLMMGTAALRRTRQNRVLVLVQDHEDELFKHAAVNSVNAARASYGMNATIAEIDPRFRMISEYTASGVAAGRIEGIDYVYELLDRHSGDFDAVAITSLIELPAELHENYYRLVDDIVNPWGGVEAMLTHAISLRYGVPAAHAPMMESREVAAADFGVVDPRLAAEVISLAFLQCVLRGLQASPGITPADPSLVPNHIQCANVSCLVIPEGCLGLATLAALQHGIPVIAVRSNVNQMRNSLESLPWRPRQFFSVENYLEAAGVIAALRAGIDPYSVTRPLDPVKIDGLSDRQSAGISPRQPSPSLRKSQ